MLNIKKENSFFAGEVNKDAALFNKAIALGVSPDDISLALKPLIRREVAKKISVLDLFPNITTTLSEKEVVFLNFLVSFLYEHGYFMDGSQSSFMSLRRNGPSDFLNHLQNTSLDLTDFLEKIFKLGFFSFSNHVSMGDWGDSFFKEDYLGNYGTPGRIQLSPILVKKIEDLYLHK